MVVRKMLFEILLQEFPGWATTSRGFVGFISLLDRLEKDEHGNLNPQLYTPTENGLSIFGNEVASIMMRELQIDLYPYDNLENLLKHNTPAVDTEVLHRVIERVQEEDQLLDMIDESGAMPSRDTMISLIATELFTEHIIDMLSPYIRFI